MTERSRVGPGLDDSFPLDFRSMPRRVSLTGAVAAGDTAGRNRCPRWRLIHDAKGDEELYDTVSDPYEWINLADRADHAARLLKLRRLGPKSFAPKVSTRGS